MPAAIMHGRASARDTGCPAAYVCDEIIEDSSPYIHCLEKDAIEAVGTRLTCFSMPRRVVMMLAISLGVANLRHDSRFLRGLKHTLPQNLLQHDFDCNRPGHSNH
jgi:hypothetical protein